MLFQNLCSFEDVDSPQGDASSDKEYVGPRVFQEFVDKANVNLKLGKIKNGCLLRKREETEPRLTFEEMFRPSLD